MTDVINNLMELYGDKSLPQLYVHTSFIGHTGYVNHSRSFFTALNKYADVRVRNFTAGDSWNGITDDTHGGETYLTQEQKNMMVCQTTMEQNNTREDFYIYEGKSALSANQINIVLNETNHYYFYDNYDSPTIAYNVWESTKYPSPFFNRLLEFDYLWVPTEWQKECHIKQGYPADKIYVVPEGVDGEVFNPDNIKMLPDYEDGRFKFLLFGRWDYRKATTEIIETFLKTFDPEEPVDLIVSIDNPFSCDGLKTTEERLAKHGFDDPRIKVKHFPSREDYIQFMKQGNVFLSCARSEGWNLPLIEAMACGTPSIYSDWGAQLQFAKGKGLPVKILGELPAAIGDDKGFNGSFLKNTPGNYCEPDFKNLSIVMRDAYENYEDHKSQALEDSELIREEFNWDYVARNAMVVLEEIASKEPILSQTREIIREEGEKELRVEQDGNFIRFVIDSGHVKVICEGDNEIYYRFIFFDEKDSNSIYTMEEPIKNNMYACESMNKNFYPDEMGVIGTTSRGKGIYVTYNSKTMKFRNRIIQKSSVLDRVGPPVIIGGMGGGGTSYASRLLRYQGMYFGTDVGSLSARKGQESRSFSMVHDILWLIDEELRSRGTIGFKEQEYAGKMVDNIEENIEEYKNLFNEYISSFFDVFWGDHEEDSIWGWKFPANCLSIPVWGKVFPGAKFLLINKDKRPDPCSQTQEGKWFLNEATKGLRDLYLNPRVPDSVDCMEVDFFELTTDYKIFNKVMEWAGLKTVSNQEEFLEVLKGTAFEGNADKGIPDFSKLENKKDWDKIDVVYSAEDNKIYFSNMGQNIKKGKIVVRDGSSNLFMFKIDMVLKKNNNIWIVPFPVNLYDLDFKEFLIEFFDEEGQLLHTKTVPVKDCEPPDDFKFINDSIDPTWINYYEMFHKKVYDNYVGVKGGGVAVDIGANRGIFTRYVLKKGYSKCYSVEPIPEPFLDLSRTFEGHEEVCLFNGAISDKDGKEIIYTPKDAASVSSMDLKEAMGNDGDNLYKSYSELEVEAMSFNSFVSNNEISHVDLLKIDIEGAEYKVFEAIDDDILSNMVSQIILEFHFNDGKVQNIIDKMKRCGFTIDAIKKQGSDEDADISMKNGMLFASKSIDRIQKIIDSHMSFLFEDRKHMDGNKDKAYHQVFTELQKRQGEIKIVETGCCHGRSGGFTLVAGEFLSSIKDGKLITVDISQSNMDKCKEITKEWSDKIEYCVGDSIKFLNKMTEEEALSVDLFFFDSLDLDIENPKISAKHALRELKAIYNKISDDALIMVDDNYLRGDKEWYIKKEGKTYPINEDVGKGVKISKFLTERGWEQVADTIDVGSNVLLFKKKDLPQFDVSIERENKGPNEEDRYRINIFPKNLSERGKYVVYWRDADTDILIQRILFDMQNGGGYWISYGADYLREAKVIIETEDGTEVFSKNFILNENEKPKLPHKLHTEKDDCSWLQYREIFYQDMYTSEKVHVEPGDVVVDLGANNGFFSLYAAIHNEVSGNPHPCGGGGMRH